MIHMLRLLGGLVAGSHGIEQGLGKGFKIADKIFNLVVHHRCSLSRIGIFCIKRIPGRALGMPVVFLGRGYAQILPPWVSGVGIGFNVFVVGASDVGVELCWRVGD